MAESRLISLALVTPAFPWRWRWSTRVAPGSCATAARGVPVGRGGRAASAVRREPALRRSAQAEADTARRMSTENKDRLQLSRQGVSMIDRQPAQGAPKQRS
jgi:hypothetical protein